MPPPASRSAWGVDHAFSRGETMAGKKRQVRSLLDLSTPEPDERDYEYPERYGGYERRLPNVQPLHQGGGELSDIGPGQYAAPNTGWQRYAPPSGMSLDNQGLGYTMPLGGGELNMQYMRPPLTAPRSSGPPEFGWMLNWRREF